MIEHCRPKKSPQIKIIESFPNPDVSIYDENLWYEQHDRSLVIIRCRSSNIYFPKHWTPLSIKCAFEGKEYYHFRNNSFAVSDENFLILNEGAEYSSSIKTESPSESFTLNFTPYNINEVYAGAAATVGDLLDDPFENYDASPRFVEKLYPHGSSVSYWLFTIRKMLSQQEHDPDVLVELMYLLLGEMAVLYNRTSVEIEDIKAKKRTTREEIYKRLFLARDYMDSCYYERISLQSLAEVCCLNSYYLLRQFKMYFKTTPHQYLINKRLTEAMKLLLSTRMGINEIQHLVGFQDISSFSKLFRKYYGRAPAMFRAAMTDSYLKAQG